MSWNVKLPSRSMPVRTRDIGAPCGGPPGTSPRASARGEPVAPGCSATKATSGSYLACCFPPNAPPGSGRRCGPCQRHSRTRARTRWSQYGCWIDAPHRDAVVVRRGDESVRLDRELSDHREAVGVLDHEIRGRAVDVAPPDVVLAKHVRVGERIVGAKRGILDERRVCCDGCSTVKAAGSSS